jgi:spoIIIJ-associated protein
MKGPKRWSPSRLPKKPRQQTSGIPRSRTHRCPRPRWSAEEPEEEPEEEVNIEEFIDAAKRGLEEIMGFAKLDLEAEIKEGDECLEIELDGVDRERLVEDRGNLLLAIQHLLPRLIRGYAGRSIPCHVDSKNFHAEREVKLRKLAEDSAAEVVERQRPRTLPPMNPAERRIIHVTLADNKEINTESQGRGFFKRVAISPAVRRPRGFDRYSR